MMSAFGPDGAIWFAEENGGYIGRFDPTTERFTTFPLASPDGDSPGPQHLQFDQHGQLWFTLNHSSQIARMDPATGAIRTWDVLPVEGERAPHPYSLAVTPEGIVWFGAALYGGVVGSLDPTSGTVTVHHLGKPTAQITSMVSDKRGNVWFTELQFNRLGHINTRTGAVTEMTLPEPVGASTGNYALDVAPDGAVWITSFDANAIIRYAPESNEFTFYTLLVPNSVPFGMVVAPYGTIWFTSDGEPNDYIGHIFP
jgi:virginiamycin B lyase